MRALYLAAGAVGVAVETGDDDLLSAIVRQFGRTLARRTYLTGGVGSRHLDESFGEDFARPAETFTGLPQLVRYLGPGSAGNDCSVRVCLFRKC